MSSTDDSNKKETETKEKEKGRMTLSLSSLGGSAAGAGVTQRRTGGRVTAGKTVKVEVVRRRAERSTSSSSQAENDIHNFEGLSNHEREARLKAIEQAKLDEERRKVEAEERAQREAEEARQREIDEKKRALEEKKSKKPLSPDDARARELEELKAIEEEQALLNAERKAREDKEAEERAKKQREQSPTSTTSTTDVAARGKTFGVNKERREADSEDDSNSRRGRGTRDDRSSFGSGNVRIQKGQAALLNIGTSGSADDDVRVFRRRRPRKDKNKITEQTREKIVREVIIPDYITVQELATRMAERGGDVVKKLFEMGMMVTITQVIDADTAELVVTDFGHSSKRISDSDIEDGLSGVEDKEEDLLSRPPVVTVMGHVDHGKTSLLDAFRKTDVVAREAGGITQHIGAYQITRDNGQKISFIDTPGHAAFTEMRSRGANTTDIVVLVVAADDGIKPQTIEAINHARAAGVPIVVAINKIDLPAADSKRIKQDLLQHNVQVEEMGGDVQCVEVSAKKKINMDKLEEAILLQAEMLELKANPNRVAAGTVIESKLDQGRGNVATVLVQNGTLRVGDIFVSGSEWGRVRALVNDKGKRVDEALPAEPIEVLGLYGAPNAGDDFVVVLSEQKARQVAEYRSRKLREAEAAKSAKGSIDQMFDKLKESERKELPVIIKADVHGSVEALAGSLKKLTEENEEVMVHILHSGVGGINESDMTLAKATGALVVGFNVRANTQARDLARRDHIDIRYYSIIYNVIDDVKQLLSGLLAPEERENITGYAEIRQIFTVPKVGKVGGCFVTEGKIGRGSKVRLLRDDVVIHEGSLSTLKRFKDDVKEVQQGYECGMAFEGYDNIAEGDIIEAYEVQEVARALL